MKEPAGAMAAIGPAHGKKKRALLAAALFVVKD
jgi:hypothetical protein